MTACLFAMFATCLVSVSMPAARPNILFIAVDDLRNDLGALGVNHAKTPDLDRLARTSRTFSRHYVQVPTCGASRCSLLRGLYPSERVHLGNSAIRDTSATWADVSLPGRLRSDGYKTYSLGKITHHPGGLTGGDWNAPPEELPGVWDRSWIPETPWKSSLGIMHGYANGKPRERGVTPPFEAFDGPDSAYPDAWIADAAIVQLRELAASDQPWFFAVGFFKPHLPFAAPKSWFDKHDPSAIPAPPADPHERDRIGWHASSELRRAYDTGGRDPATDPAYATELRRAYEASASYSDAQLGRVLAELERLGLEENTILVVWSDHGFLLGEHGVWGKHSLHEEALRSPLMIRYPGMPAPGAVSDAIVETVDIYPTLLDLCGLPAQHGLDGLTLRAQLENPAAPASKPARSFWNNGRSLRTSRWQLIAGRKPGADADSVELYDLANDPAGLTDVAGDRPEIVSGLLADLNARPDPR